MGHYRADRVPSTPRLVSWLLAAAGLGLAGCADEALSPTPVELELGAGLRANIVDGSRLVIRAADGRVLLDGLGPVAGPPDGPPLGGFAVRDATPRYEMRYGSFRPIEAPAGPWRGGRWIRLNRLAPISGGAMADGAETGTGAAGSDAVRAELAIIAEGGSTLLRLELSSPEPGHLVMALAPGDGVERRVSLGFSCDAADHFVGFGAQTWDVDHRGQSVPCFVQEQGIGKVPHDDYEYGDWMIVGRRHSSHLPLPQYFARRGYALTAQTALPVTFALCSESEAALRIEVNLPATIHLFDGPSPAVALERSSATFGRPRLPPRVAFAPWLDAIYGSDNVRRVAQKLRDEQIPASVIWTEDWRGGEWSGDTYALKEEWEVDRSVYPDFEQLADELHDLGFHWHVYFNPFVYQGSKAWQQTQPQGWLVQCPAADGSGLTDCVFTGAKFEPTGLLDLDHPQARAWAVGKMRDVIALGADGWMNDYAEWLPTDAVTAAGTGLERHNVYPVVWQQIAREAIDSVGDGRERLFFGRSGWLGTPQLADVIWAGDQRTTLDVDDGLPTVLPIGIGLGVAGVSTYGHDIAGYQAATNEGSTREVFFRWTEVGAWSPVMRTHHGAQPDGNWSWETDAETVAHFKRYAELHISLLPVFEALAWQAAQTGVPIWRGMALEFPEDASVWPIVDQVMVGPRLLLAPVLEPAAQRRSVYLPRGRWYPWSGGEPARGPRTIQAAAPLEEIPVFVRAGAVMPTLPAGVMTLVHGSAAVADLTAVGDDRVVYGFAGGRGAFEEVGGLRYELDTTDPVPASAETASQIVAHYDGERLAECEQPAVAPCVQVSERAIAAHVTGPGALAVQADDLPLGRLQVIGGSASRKLILRVRW